MQLHSHSLLMVSALRLGAVAVVLLVLPLLLPVWNVTPLGVALCAGVPGAVVVEVWVGVEGLIRARAGVLGLGVGSKWSCRLKRCVGMALAVTGGVVVVLSRLLSREIICAKCVRSIVLVAPLRLLELLLAWFIFAH
jgi:hypothetical protein